MDDFSDLISAVSDAIDDVQTQNLARLRACFVTEIESLVEIGWANCFPEDKLKEFEFDLMLSLDAELADADGKSSLQVGAKTSKIFESFTFPEVIRSSRFEYIKQFESSGSYRYSRRDNQIQIYFTNLGKEKRVVLRIEKGLDGWPQD